MGKGLKVLIIAALMVMPVTSAALELKIATVAPEGSSWMKAMRLGAEEINERTGGRVILKLYGGGIMGSEKTVFRKIRTGQLHGGAFTGSALEEVFPDARLYGLPLVFRSYEEFDYVRARMDQDLLDGLEKAGFVSFGFAEAGISQLMAGVPVRTIADMRGHRAWVPEGDTISYAVMESLGLAPVPLPITDVMTGLQTGLIDAIGTSAIGAIAFQWHTRVKYVTDTPLAFLFGTLIIDKRTFSRLSPQDQQVVREVMSGLYLEFGRKTREENAAAAAALVKYGLIMVEQPPEEAERWRQSAEATIRRLAGEGTFSPVMYARLQELLSEYRKDGAISARE
jgi:TRAP-type transport system periplasmic protein